MRGGQSIPTQASRGVGETTSGSAAVAEPLARPVLPTGYMALMVSATSIVFPPTSTGQLLASLTAASRLSALMTL